MNTLTPDQQFFFDHAGTSWNPVTETEQQGKIRGAIALAEAEALYLHAHRVADVSCEWEHDPDDSGDGDSTPEIREMAFIWHRKESGDCEYLASLGSIEDADANYRRVIRAELASECTDALRAIIAGA